MIRRFAPIESLDALVRRAREARSAARWSEATELYREATRDAVRFGRPFVVVECLNALGAIAFEVGDLHRAERRFELALRLARSSGHARGEAGALVNLGAIANVRGDYGDAIGHYRSGRWAYRRAGSAAGEARALNNLGMVLADVGRWDAASRCYRKARDLARDLGDEDLLGLVSINATEVWLALGEHERARRSASEASRHFRRAGDPAGRAEVARFMGQIERIAGRTRRAESLLRMAADGGRRLEAPLGEAEALRELGHLYLAEGRHRSALECLGRSTRLFRKLDAARDLAELRGRVEELEGLILEIVQRIGHEVEAHDSYLYGHSARVAEYAVAIACDLGFEPDAMKGILVAGYLHDVGKLQVDPQILNKAGRLTEAEMEAVRLHPTLGVEHLARFELPWDIEATVRGHHERYDGTGYPDGLAGERIPIGARILLVADVYDALTTSRSYRDPWSREQALTYLAMSAGTLSDPEITNVFVEIARRESFGPKDSSGVRDQPMSPEEMVRTFAALPVGDWTRTDEELVRT
ncbi:MAG TPA: HD domain-containing phosphohydrolase [Gemmatimonadota bacterium]|jgi:putative two-component system response regulator|nr:HD domain-containing phosphohydrolase [Gemmatimonadota bacterium]